MRFVGGLTIGNGTFARILNRQRSSDDDDLAHATVPVGLEHHAAESRIKWQPSESATERGQPASVGRLILIDGPKFFKQRNAIANRSTIGRIKKVELAHIAETERRHLQDDRCEVGAQDLGLGELGPLIEVVLGVQPQTHPRSHSSAPAGTLVRRGLRDRLDG